ncbi:MAG: type II toxin-antitoxin system PemK/MazF family toxin [bacterium]
MKKEYFAEKIKKLLISIKNEIITFFPDKSKRAIKLLKWFKETIIKNNIIYKSIEDENKNHEEYRRRRTRGKVYWTQFGENVGSEFNGNHFSVVLYESYYTAIVVPLSSVKENEGKWKDKEDLVVKIGEIKGLPRESPECYALVHQMRAVSKKRLDDFLDKKTGQYIKKLKLTNKQLDLIDDKVRSICKKK